jgi:hypothetical protein
MQKNTFEKRDFFGEENSILNGIFGEHGLARLSGALEA